MTAKQIKALRARRVPPTGNRIPAACDISGLSQMDCARATGLTPQYINNVVRGRIQSVTVPTAHKFAEFFGCQIEDLFPSREAVAS